MIRNQIQVKALQSNNFSTHNDQQIQKTCANEKMKAERKVQSFAIKQSFTRPQMAVRKKKKVFLLTPTKKFS